MKQGIHGKYFNNVEVACMCGASYTISAAVPGPIKLENCPVCHPAFNKGVAIVKESKGMRQKYEEKMAKMKSVQSKKAA